MTHKENHQAATQNDVTAFIHAVVGRRHWHRLISSTGFTIGQAGGFGTLLSFMVGAVVVYLIMLCLGELAVHMPVTGSFHTYIRATLGQGLGSPWLGCIGSHGQWPWARRFTGAGLVA